MGLIDRVTSSIASGSIPLTAPRVAEEARRLLSDEFAAARHPDALPVVDHLVGLGPIGALLRDPQVSDVLVNGPDEIWVERGGELVLSPVRFESTESIHTVVQRVIAPLGVRLDRSSPMVDARLADGSRLHAVVPPAAVDSPVIAIRRFTPAIRSLDDLVAEGSATEDQTHQLRELVAAGENILISGGTGTGKTTLLNLLSRQIPQGERVVTIEDAAELNLAGHVVRLEAHPPNAEGAGEVTIRSLLRSALRLRPDRIILGEVRGPEALDLIWALNTGHRGSMSTVHANSPEEAMWRLETLALSADVRSAHAIGRQLYAAIGIVVQLERVRGRRRIVEIAKVTNV